MSFFSFFFIFELDGNMLNGMRLAKNTYPFMKINFKEEIIMTTIKETKMKELKGKVKNGLKETKEFMSENKALCVTWGAIIGGSIVLGVLGHQHDKKFENAWRAAKEALDNNDLEYDFGPYKVMKILEPKTGELIGQTMCHEDTTNLFLNLK